MAPERLTTPLSLYVHMPWCIKKCPYCDFNSHPLRADIPEVAYIDALINDLEHDLPACGNRPLRSIFIGGGTPSLFSGQALARLLNAVQRRIARVDDMEITLEANPGAVEQDRFQSFYAAGINRLSLGCQSFQDNKLAALGRIHNAKQAQQAINAAKHAGFDNINIDLMFGLPQQTLADALSDLQTAIDLTPAHISWYQLTLEPNTLFYQKPPKLPDHDRIADMQERGQRLLAQQGYQQYEISAYAKQGYCCQHNINYWQFGDYLGIGAGAHSKITDIISGKVERIWKLKHPKAYLKANANNYIEGKEVITDKALAFEFMLNALRLLQPIDIDLFEQRTGIKFTAIKNEIRLAVTNNFIIVNDGKITKTALGTRFLNDLIALFLQDA